MDIESGFVQQLSVSQSPPSGVPSTTPLHLLLLSHRGALVTIAKFINYPHNPEIPLLSVKIMHHIALRPVCIMFLPPLLLLFFSCFVYGCVLSCFFVVYVRM